MDFELKNPEEYYYTMVRALAKFSAWDKRGRYDECAEVFGGLQADPCPPQITPQQRQAAARPFTRYFDVTIDFVQNVAPHLFTPRVRDASFLSKFKDDATFACSYLSDITWYQKNNEDFITLVHSNLQVDNAYFWRDENGVMQCGLLDWFMCSRAPFVNSFLGGMCGAEGHVLAEHDVGLMQCFASEYHKHGGPMVDVDDLVLRLRLGLLATTIDSCRYVQTDILGEVPRKDWNQMRTVEDVSAGPWNARCRVMALLNLLDYWSRRDLVGELRGMLARQGVTP